MTVSLSFPTRKNVIPDLIGNLKTKKSAKFFKKVLHFYFLCLYLQSQMKGKPIIGVWRSWLAHLVWDQRVLCSSHSTPTYSESNYLDFKWLLFSLYGSDDKCKYLPPPLEQFQMGWERVPAKQLNKQEENLCQFSSCLFNV